MKLTQSKVFSFTMKSWEEEISGVYFAEGKEWILINDNPSDFILDGFRFIYKANISEIKRGVDEIFKERVFKLKGSLNSNIKKVYNLDNSVLLFRGLINDKIIMQYDADNEYEIFVGNVLEADEDSFKIESVTTRGELSSSYRCNTKK